MIAKWNLTTPVAQPSQTAYRIGDPLDIMVSTGIAQLLYQGETSGGLMPNIVGKLDVPLTAADVQQIVNIVLSRASALGMGVPAGTVSVA